MTLLEIIARPGSRADSVNWDPWRKRWVFSCRAEAVDGEANAALIRICAEHLGLPQADVRLQRGSRSRVKVLAVRQLSLDEIVRRLGGRPRVPETTDSEPEGRTGPGRATRKSR